MMLSKRRYAQSSSNERILFYEYLRYFRSRHGRPFQLSYRRSGTNRTDHPAAPWCRACTRGNFPFRFLCSYRHRTRHRPCADRRLLGMQPDDIRIPDSFSFAAEAGLTFTFHKINLKDAHPNTAILRVSSADGRTLEVQAASLGGGRILVNRLDGIRVNFTGDAPTLIVHNLDKPGCVANVTSLLSRNGVNIATMQLYRNYRGGYAVMVVETDQNIAAETLELLRHLDGVTKVTYLAAD